ncbi:ParB/RepB/Spo0J family partition protein [Streptomyces sp. O3]
MGRRTSLASLAGAKVDDVPGKSDPLLLSLPLAKLIPTRFNPRRNFGTEEQLEEFGRKLKQQQLQPAVVVSRSGYLKLWPEEAERVGDIPYVIANGERRFRASALVGRPTLDVVHNEELARSRAQFLDAVLSENNDREDLDPIERALGIETMVLELGGADKVAKHYGKSNPWVSNQRKLLRLTPELQQLVSSGELSIRVGREIAGLPQEEQASAWQAELDRRVAVQAAPRAPRRTPEDPPAAEPAPPAEVSPPTEPADPADPAVNTVPHQGPQQGPPQEPQDTPSQAPPQPRKKAPDAPEQPAEAGGASQAPTPPAPVRNTPTAALQTRPAPLPDGTKVSAIPWHSPETVFHTLRHRMTSEDLHCLHALLQEHVQDA